MCQCGVVSTRGGGSINTTSSGSVGPRHAYIENGVYWSIHNIFYLPAKIVIILQVNALYYVLTLVTLVLCVTVLDKL